jgi:hypothetical protein
MSKLLYLVCILALLSSGCSDKDSHEADELERANQMLENR